MRTHTYRRSLLTLVGVALLLSSLHARTEPQTTATSTIQDLRGVDELKMMFNCDAGKVRLVLLLSPT